MKRSHSSPLSLLFPWLSPLVISFAIVDGGIEVQVSQNGRLLKGWQPSRLRRMLPEPLVKWMEDQRIHMGPQPYPLIKYLWNSLLPHASKKLIIDPLVVAELRESSQPQDFALIWELNCSLERIEGHYKGVDRYLGMGWFQRGQNIWSLKSQPSAELDKHLKNPIYPLQHATVLLGSNIPYLQQYLPTRADFQIITDFLPQVIVHNVSSSAVTLGLQCNYPQLLSMIRVPKGDFDVLLADRAVFQFSRQALTPVMTYLLQSGSAITLEGESIPLFIREQLPTMLRHHQINDDLAATISQAHPIVSIPTLKPTSSLAHTFENGIGKYRISAIYRYQQHVLDIDVLLTAHQRSQRFVRQHGIWFEWAENAQSFVHAVLQQRTTQALLPEEVMGFDTQRTALLPDPPSTHTIQPVGTIPLERAQSAFRQLRQHGVPGGLVGELPGLVPMFVKACEDLVHDNRQARILWVAPSNKKGSVTRAVNASTMSSYVTVASPVTLRDEPALLSHLWTLVIFQELDKLLDGSSISLRFDYIPWKWALISIASKRSLSSSILRALRFPEKYSDQFGARCLFDPLKSYAGSGSGKGTSVLNSAQKAPTQQDGSAMSLRPSSTPTPARPASSVSAHLADPTRSSTQAQREQLVQQIEMLKQRQVLNPPASGASSAPGRTVSPVPHSVGPKPAISPKSRSIELNQRAIARLQQESEQLRERLTVEDEEEQRSLLSITQQDANASGGSSGLANKEAKQVPEKVVSQRNVDPRSDTEQSQKKEPVLSTAQTEALSFWEKARQWKDRSHKPVSLERFKHYHPDYTLMNTKQLGWYFYWRNEIRSSRYPATDVGYIFLHTYEALGCIGFMSPAQACDRLIALWRHYRGSFPDLDKYLIPWIADFCVVYTLSLTPMQWYTQVLAVPDCDIDAQLVAEAWLRQGGDWTKIPAAVLYKLVGFNTQTKFYQKMREKHALDDGYRGAIAAVDQYLSSKFDRPALITRYGKGKICAVEREPFKWALVEQAYAPITVATINAAFTDTGFLQVLSGILKYADHVQRKLYQSTVSPFAPTIDVNWQEAIDAILTNKPAVRAKAPEGQVVSKSVIPASPQILPSVVRLDAGALSKLREESDQLQERLTIEVEAEYAPQHISIAEAEPVTPVTSNISSSELEVDEDWKDIAQQWRLEHWEVLRLLRQGKLTELAMVERQARRPLSRLIDEINSPVDEVLGDLLIDPDTRTIASHLQSNAEMLLDWYFASKEK